MLDAEERIDWVFPRLRRRYARPDRGPERPMIARIGRNRLVAGCIRARVDPTADRGGLFRLQRLTFRRHPQFKVVRRYALDQQATLRVAPRDGWAGLSAFQNGRGSV